MYDNLHWQALKKLCAERNIDTAGAYGKAAYIKLLQDNDMNLPAQQEQINTPPLIINPTPADLQAVNINTQAMRLDKLRADLNALQAVVSVRTEDGMAMSERRYGSGRYAYSIDTNENTIHFMGGTVGLRCETLSQPDKLILRIAHNYLLANTVAGRNMQSSLIA